MFPMRRAWFSALPARSVYLRCCRIDLTASEFGAHTDAVLRRHRSFRLARIVTLTVRFSGYSGCDVLKLLASASACSLPGSATAPADVDVGACIIIIGSPW